MVNYEKYVLIELLIASRWGEFVGPSTPFSIIFETDNNEDGWGMTYNNVNDYMDKGDPVRIRFNILNKANFFLYFLIKENLLHEWVLNRALFKKELPRKYETLLRGHADSRSTKHSFPFQEYIKIKNWDDIYDKYIYERNKYFKKPKRKNQ